MYLEVLLNGRKGAIGVLTSGRVYRDELEEYAVMMALTKIVSRGVYENEWWKITNLKRIGYFFVY